MKKNDNVVGDRKCDQFYQVNVYTGRDEVCAECCRPYLRSLLRQEAQLLLGWPTVLPQL